MRRIILSFAIVLLCCTAAQAPPVPPYVTIFMRTVLDDPDAATARTTLGLGTGDSPQFTNLILSGYGELAEIATPATPDPNTVRFYTKDDGDGVSLFYFLDGDGLETNLTGGGGGATTLDALLDVALGLTPYTDGKVLRADGSQYVDAVLAHGDLSDIGTNTHAQIDTHLASTDNPHSVTAAQAGAVALTGNESIDGIKTFTSFPVLPSAMPTADYQAVPKIYADAFVQGLEVKAACRVATTAAATLADDFEDGDTIDGITLAEDDRILIKDQADGTENGIYIVEAAGAPTRADDYDATSEVQEGTYCYITEGTLNEGFQFVQITLNPVLDTNPLVFTYLTKPGSHTASLGVELVGADIRADLLATGAIGLTGNELKVNVDDSSIEISGNALQVKAAGVTNAMLAGSIEDNKLNTISTADKVDWAAVNKTGSALDDIANVNAPNPSDDQALAWDTVSSQWIPQTLSGGGGVVNAAIMDVDLYSSGVSDASWKMDAATEELFGSTSSRIKLDLTYATHYRLVVNQTVAGYSGADFNLQYSTNNVDYLAADAGAAGELDVGEGVGVKVGDWADLVAGAQGDVWLRLVGKDGNGKVTARWRQVRIQFKMLSTGGAAPTNAQYVTLAVDGTLSQERVLAGTAGQITVTDGGAGNNVTLALVNYNDSDWDTAYGWGDHAGLYEPDLTDLASLVSAISDVTKFFTDDDIVGPSADPDLDALGELGIDTDGGNEPNSVTLRTADTGGDTQYVLANTDKSFCFTIASPDALEEATFLPVWKNKTGFTFHITEIGGESNVDDFDFTLKERDADGGNVTTIEAVQLTTDGTGMYYGSVAAAGIDHAVIETGHTVGFVKSADDATYVLVYFKGYFDADVP